MAKAMKQKAQWKNRIVGYGEAPAIDFLANDKNWRVHPKPQQDTLHGVLDEIGWVQDVIVNKRTSDEWPEGERNIETLVDGHLRITLALREGDSTPVPVKYVDLTPGEESLVLMTLDPISAMAAADKAQVDELLRQVQTSDAAVQAMLADVAAKSGVVPVDGGEWGEAFGGIPDEDRAPFQQMTFTLHDSQVETVKAALKAAQAGRDFADSPNKNSNGNALALICEAFTDGR